MEKQNRVDIVNQIISEIAKRGRRFFYNEKTGLTASLFLKKTKLYYKCEWIGQKNITEICLSIADYQDFKGWYHGGTLKALVKDFKQYIDTGNYSNHEHGYGGLYCPHWGYSTEDMQGIQKLAIKLGYLQPSHKP